MVPRSALPVLIILLSHASPGSGQSPRGSGVRGTITTAAGRALAGATVVRRSAADTIRADSLGRYVVRGLATGRHVFTVAHPGFAPIEMEIEFQSDTTVDVDIPLDTLRVDPVAAKLERVGFIARRRQNAGLRVTFLGPEEIRSHNATRVTQLFERIPDVHVETAAGGARVVLGRDRRCIMIVWIEGRADTTIALTQYGRGFAGRIQGIDEQLLPQDVAGVEVYPRPDQVPVQFQLPRVMRAGRGEEDMRIVECGAVAIWTRH